MKPFGWIFVMFSALQLLRRSELEAKAEYAIAQQKEGSRKPYKTAVSPRPDCQICQIAQCAGGSHKFPSMTLSLTTNFFYMFFVRCCCKNVSSKCINPPHVVGRADVQARLARKLGGAQFIYECQIFEPGACEAYPELEGLIKAETTQLLRRDQ